ncbi:MAG: 16S rRNA (adenine(1518)-N(6)/adenine(1519)-N(6))-dimethyltransferase RsmA [Clostridia bacterium]|nr:16S rRNA (adenine(1518)-N(6)/adenine(1519)-N(6))-dimethyltransferase RsmA [Clostridia bacterium]
MIQQKAYESLKRHGFHFNKSLGQNFLLNDGIISDIVEKTGIARGDRVVEIGAGAGVLTAKLASTGAKVIAIEIDKNLEPVLREVLAGYDARIIIADALKCDIAALFPETRFHVVANLPYYITTDVMMNLTAIDTLDSITVLVQQEAASRIAANVGEEGYCALSAVVRLFGKAQTLMDVEPGAFTPPPHVQSSLLRVERHDDDTRDKRTIDATRRVIRAVFAMRRKTLVNNITSAFGLTKQQTTQIVESCGLSANIRGEALGIDEMTRLARELIDREIIK